MRSRRAKPGDVKAVHALISSYAQQGILLPRTQDNVREHLSTLLVLEERSEVIGCVSLEAYGRDLAEIRSLAVNSEMRGRGLGGKLVEFALAEARRKRIARVFAVTHAPAFFVRHGFGASSRNAVPEKLERDCRICSKARHCRLTAVIATVIPDRVALPILNGIATPSLA